MSEAKQYNCYDCYVQGGCHREQKFVMPCADFTTLCCGLAMAEFLESSDVKRLICSKKSCSNTGVVKFADGDELPDYSELCSPWQVDDGEDNDD